MEYHQSFICVIIFTHVFHNYLELQQYALCIGLTKWCMDSFMRASLVIVIGCKSHPFEVPYCVRRYLVAYMGFMVV